VRKKERKEKMNKVRGSTKLFWFENLSKVRIDAAPVAVLALTKRRKRNEIMNTE
jgi:hypothetical protein